MKISINQLRQIISEALSIPQEDLGDYELTEFRQFVAQFLKDNGTATQKEIITAWLAQSGKEYRKMNSDAFRHYSTTTYDHNKFNKGSLVARGWLVPAGKQGTATLWKLSPRGESELLGSDKKIKAVQQQRKFAPRVTEKTNPDLLKVKVYYATKIDENHYNVRADINWKTSKDDPKNTEYSAVDVNFTYIPGQSIVDLIDYFSGKKFMTFKLSTRNMNDIIKYTR